MKKAGKIAGIMLMIILATTINLPAQRGMRGLRMDSARMRSDSSWKRMDRRQSPYVMRNDSAFRQRFDRGIYRGMRPMPGMRQGFVPGGYRMMPGRHMGMIYGPGRGMHPGFRQMPPMAFGNLNRGNFGPGRGLMENIPGLNEKQKSEIEKLNADRREQMQKLMQEHRDRLKQMREDNRKKMMEILNDEQKKWMEEHDPADRI